MKRMNEKKKYKKSKLNLIIQILPKKNQKNEIKKQIKILRINNKISNS